MTAHDDDELRAAFASRPAGPPSAGCPSPDELMQAYFGASAPERRRAIVAHLAECAACAADWRLARTLLPDDVGSAAPEKPPLLARVLVGPWGRPVVGLAAAAVLVVALASGLMWRLGPAGPTSDYRQGEQAEVRSLLPDDAPLPRDACRLRWSLEAAGARFAVTVSGADLEPLAEARDLAQAEFSVPASALQALPDGAPLLWQVTARLPDGSSLRSVTFRARLAAAVGSGTRSR